MTTLRIDKKGRLGPPFLLFGGTWKGKGVFT